MIYTVEINGRGIAALGDKNVVEEEHFRGDLLAMTSQGKLFGMGKASYLSE
jgi:hypothetical protein